MRSRKLRRLTAFSCLAAYCCLSTTAGLSWGFVLCVGPDDHREIEPWHGDSNCPNLSHDCQDDPAAAHSISNRAGNCVDIPIPVHDLMVTGDKHRVSNWKMPRYSTVRFGVENNLESPDIARRRVEYDAISPIALEHLSKTVLLI